MSRAVLDPDSEAARGEFARLEWAPSAHLRGDRVRPGAVAGGSIGAQATRMMQLSPRRFAALGAVLFLAAACGDDVDGGMMGPDAGASNHPPNPSGLGPAPLDLGASGDLSAAGSYAILAKTGITNVTGSSITGGHLGLSPAAATFITGFGMTADSTNVFSTSASVVAPSRIYASNYAVPTPSNLTTAVLEMQTAYTD